MTGRFTNYRNRSFFLNKLEILYNNILSLSPVGYYGKNRYLREKPILIPLINPAYIKSFVFGVINFHIFEFL